MKDLVHYWAHMLDESSHSSYYEVYMMEHPEDEAGRLANSLIEQFAKDMKKDRIDLRKCVKNGIADMKLLEDMQASIKHKYVWQKIKAQEYAAIISRMTALLSRAKG